MSSLHRELKKNAKRQFARLHTSRYHYRKTFSGVSGEYVLKDLALRCDLNGDLYREDVGKERYLLGQRRLLLTVLAMMNKTDEEIAALTRDRDLFEETE